MNERFHALPKEKQLRIINAAMEVFAKYEYKRASTDDIAARAGISKGLLFYYFHNKKALYFYVYEYCWRLTMEQVLDEHFEELDDYFDILEYSAEKKCKLMTQNPYLLDFAVRSFYSNRDEVSEELQKNVQKTMDGIAHYFQNVRVEKFREGVDVARITRMLLWMTDGYMNDRRRDGQPIVASELREEFQIWTEMFRKLTYREEYL